MLALDEPCPECGGKLILKAGPGRLRRYRGEDGFEIPAMMKLPTCEQCGSLWLDSEMISTLGSVFESERLRRQSGPYRWPPLTALGQLHVKLRHGLSANTAVTVAGLSSDGVPIVLRTEFSRPAKPSPQPDPKVPRLREYASPLPFGENRPDAR
jgi:hypothetical protein